MKPKKLKSQKSSKKILTGKTRNNQYLINDRSETGPKYVLVSSRVIQAINKSQKE